jgi:DNA invertase Pin-like site-specific DNA recombinase
VADVGYARVSTLDQDLTIQLAALEAAGCWPIHEEKASGAAKVLPVRAELLRQLQPGDRLTVWKLDRLGRSVAEILAIIRDLDQRRIAFRSVTQPVDTSGYMGRAFLQLLAVFAELEREMILERTAAGKARRRAEGKHPGGPRMFGYEADTETINQAEATLLTEAARRVADGEPLGRIVEDWNGRGLRPLRGERWRVTPLRRMLLNDRAAAIVGEQAHRRLVALFRAPERQHLGRPAEHLLSGILTCGRPGCGQPLYAAHKTGKTGVPQLVYRCKRAAGSGGRFTGCGATVVSLPRADAWAGEAFLAAVVSPDFAAALDRRRAALAATEPTAADLEDMQAELGELEAILPTRYGTPDLRRRQAELRRLVSEATARLMAHPELEAMVDLPTSEAKLRAAWDGWSVAERRVWLRRLLERIEVGPATSHHRGSDVEARFRPVWKVV